VKIRRVIWLYQIRDKILRKHGVRTVEVEETLRSRPVFRFVQRGNRKREDVYSALGRADSGRLLIVFFVYKLSEDALIISARDMDAKERRLHEKAKR
jgi:hypothetical protein